MDNGLHCIHVLFILVRRQFAVWKFMSDPLGRKHQIKRRPTNRDHVNSVCDYILEHENKDFRYNQRPSAKHVYYDAYVVMYGTAPAIKMLEKAKDEYDNGGYDE